MKLRPGGSETGDRAQVAEDKKKKSRICQLWVWNFKGRYEKHPLGHLETWTTCRAEELALLEGLVRVTCCSRRFTRHTSSHWILRMIPCVREHSPKESDEENKDQGGWVTCLRLYEEWTRARFGSRVLWPHGWCSAHYSILPWQMYLSEFGLTWRQVGKGFQDDLLRKGEPLTVPADVSDLF